MTMNKNNLLVVALLVLIVGAIYFFSLAVDTVLFPDTSPSASYEMAPPEPGLEPAPPPEPPTPEEETARRALRDGRILPGTAADKLLNFLLSGKRNFSRELYELKYHQFDAQQAPTDSLNLELQQIAQILNAYQSLELDIASHTDGNGDKKEQREISEARAKKIKAVLVAEGVAADRIKTIGYGASYPIADSDTPLGRQMNRRVEIIIRRL
jgi:outer membrane protein OmpA-like peptidoglycan-associated protein